MKQTVVFDFDGVIHSWFAWRYFMKTNEMRKSVFYTDDPIADFHAWDAHQTKKLEQLPTCADCGEHIQEEEDFYMPF